MTQPEQESEYMRGFFCGLWWAWVLLVVTGGLLIAIKEFHL